ncbi:MAG: histidine phosphatase family protein [Candidatus Latescibacterota bacterium]
MAGSTRLILIRHGETVWNLEGRYQGHLDSPLTPRGRAQARAAGRRLRHVPFDHLYSSDLGRSVETALAISRLTGHAVKPDARLRERNFGVFHGLTLAAIQTNRPGEYADSMRGGVHYVIPEGESLLQLHQRVVACMEELATRHAEQVVVVVGHGGSLSAMIKHALRLPPDPVRPFRVYNAALNVVQRDGDRWLLESLGDAAHLQNLEAADSVE